MISCPGAWKNFEEMEESLSLAELNQILDSSRKMKMDDKKFFAAIQGIDLDKGSKEDTSFEAVKKRAQARIKGVTEEEIDFAEVGIAIEEWED